MTTGQGPVRVSSWTRPDESAPDANHGGADAPRIDDGSASATNLQRLYTDLGQSPWLDNLTRRYLRDGTLSRMVAAGVRGVTANPTIFANAIEGSTDYDEQFTWLMSTGRSVE
jgi:hypothetical protein